MKLILVLGLLFACSVASLGITLKRIQYRGKPMFMIGVYNHPLGAANKAVLDDLTNSGFNTLLVPPNTSDEVFDEMGRLGIRAVATLGYDMDLPADEAAKAQR